MARRATISADTISISRQHGGGRSGPIRFRRTGWRTSSPSPGPGWVTTSTAAKLTASGGAAGDDFGDTISISRRHGGGRSGPIRFRRHGGGVRVHGTRRRFGVARARPLSSPHPAARRATISATRSRSTEPATRWWSERTNPLPAATGRPTCLRSPPPPAVTGISPTAGPLGGGTSVTITGGRTWRALSSVFWQHGGDQLYQRHGQRIVLDSPVGSGGGGRDGGYAAWDLREVVGR